MSCHSPCMALHSRTSIASCCAIDASTWILEVGCSFLGQRGSLQRGCSCSHHTRRYCFKCIVRVTLRPRHACSQVSSGKGECDAVTPPCS